MLSKSLCRPMMVAFALLLILSCSRNPKAPSDDIDGIIDQAGELPEPRVYVEDDTLSVQEELVNVGTNVETWVCREIRRSIGEAPEEFPIFSPNADVIWPGAALQGASITSPTPDRIIAKRGTGKVVINNITGTFHSSESVPEVTISNILGAANKIIADQPDKFPANLAISIERVRTKEEFALRLQANASFFGLFSSSASFNFDENDVYSRFLVTLNQAFYALIFERPPRVQDFFHPDVTPGDLAPFIGPNNPPAYISSVTYGRIFYLLIESTEDWRSMSGSISADFLFGGASGSFKHISELKNLRVQAFAFGGDKDEALNAVLGGLSNLQSFLTSLKAGAQIRSALPLSYVLRSVRSDKVVKNGLATEYVIKDCAPQFSNGITITHRGNRSWRPSVIIDGVNYSPEYQKFTCVPTIRTNPDTLWLWQGSYYYGRYFPYLVYRGKSYEVLSSIAGQNGIREEGNAVCR